jgi:hypothetical protein
MLVLTTRTSIWFGMLILYIALLHSRANASAQVGAPTAQVTVAVHNDAHVPLDTVVSAESTASRIFREAGLNVEWMNCVGVGSHGSASPCTKAAYPTYLHIRIVARARNLPGTTFGIAYLSADGSGCYSSVFLQPIAHLHAIIRGQGVAPVLGHVMAHEIAHLLLGTNSHAAEGIMRARWQRDELLSASRGALLFTVGQAQLMRQRLSAVGRPTVGD